MARFLAGQFSASYAIDIAYKQPQIAWQGVTFLRGAAEALPFKDRSVDLIISMQALHHFNVEAHLAEAERILRPGGVFAALAWGKLDVPAPFAARFEPFVAAISPFWGAERDWVNSGYEGLVLSGKKLILPQAAMTRHLTLQELHREMEGWSATRNARASGLDLDTLLPPHAGTEAFLTRWPVVGQASIA